MTTFLKLGAQLYVPAHNVGLVESLDRYAGSPPDDSLLVHFIEPVDYCPEEVDDEGEPANGRLHWVCSSASLLIPQLDALTVGLDTREITVAPVMQHDDCDDDCDCDYCRYLDSGTEEAEEPGPTDEELLAIEEEELRAAKARKRAYRRRQRAIRT